MSLHQAAQAQKVSKVAVFKLVEKYKEFGWDALKDHKTGRPETLLNRNLHLPQGLHQTLQRKSTAHEPKLQNPTTSMDRVNPLTSFVM